MLAKRLFTLGTIGGLAALVLTGALVTSPAVHADDEHSNSDAARIDIGFQVAPVHLTYDKSNRKLVGLGSYIVNVMSDCNGCHSAGPATQFDGTHNPYIRAFTPPVQEDTTKYLGGGRDFLQIGPVIISPTIPPHIISRNLTPDDSGLPEQGADFNEFYNSMRFGIDHDHLHPNCPTPITATTTNCFPPPLNGDKLQIMPWPAYQDFTDHDLRAIYEYLKAIPCIASPGHKCH
jgi:hypothetical protein